MALEKEIIRCIKR